MPCYKIKADVTLLNPLFASQSTLNRRSAQIMLMFLGRATYLLFLQQQYFHRHS